nr:MAG TPA: hypothetical protein [Caudoviricetes sp.]
MYPRLNQVSSLHNWLLAIGFLLSLEFPCRETQFIFY